MLGHGDSKRLTVTVAKTRRPPALKVLALSRGFTLIVFQLAPYLLSIGGRTKRLWADHLHTVSVLVSSLDTQGIRGRMVGADAD